jgi:hypothetical protein
VFLGVRRARHLDTCVDWEADFPGESERWCKFWQLSRWWESFGTEKRIQGINISLGGSYAHRHGQWTVIAL